MERRIYLYADMVKIPTLTLTQIDTAELIRLSAWTELSVSQDANAIYLSGDQTQIYQFLINAALNGWHFTLF